MDLPATQAYDDDEPSSQQFEKRIEVVGTLEVDDRSYNVSTGSNMIGRHPACAIRLEHETISKKHAEIEADTVEKPVFIRDLNSSNKTKINDSKLKPNLAYQIKDGDKLTFGKVVGTFKIHKVIEDSIVSSTPQVNKKMPSIIPGTPDSFNASVCDSDVSAILGTQTDEPNFRRPQVPVRLSTINNHESPKISVFCSKDLPSPVSKVKTNAEDISESETQKASTSYSKENLDDSIFSAATQKIINVNKCVNIYEMETQRPDHQAENEDDIENLQTQQLQRNISPTCENLDFSIHRAETPKKEILENLETQKYDQKKSTCNDQSDESIYMAATQKRNIDLSNNESLENLEAQEPDLSDNNVSIYSAETQRRRSIVNQQQNKRYSSNDVSIHSALTQKLLPEISNQELIENFETQQLGERKSPSSGRKSNNVSIYDEETQKLSIQCNQSEKRIETSNDDSIENLETQQLDERNSVSCNRQSINDSIYNQETCKLLPVSSMGTKSEVSNNESIHNLETQKCQDSQFQTPTILKRSVNKSLLGTGSKKVTFDNTIDELGEVETQKFETRKSISAANESNDITQLEKSSKSIHEDNHDISLQDLETQKFEKLPSSPKSRTPASKKRLSLRTSMPKQTSETTLNESISDLETQKINIESISRTSIQEKTSEDSITNEETQKFIDDKNQSTSNKSNLCMAKTSKRLSLKKLSVQSRLSNITPDESTDDIETQQFDKQELSKIINESSEEIKHLQNVNQSSKIISVEDVETVQAEPLDTLEKLDTTVNEKTNISCSLENNLSVKVNSDKSTSELLKKNNSQHEDDEEEIFCSQNLIADCPFSYLDGNNVDDADESAILSANSGIEKKTENSNMSNISTDFGKNQKNRSAVTVDDSETDEEGILTNNLSPNKSIQSKKRLDESRKSVSNKDQDESETDEEGVFSNSLPKDESVEFKEKQNKTKKSLSCVNDDSETDEEGVFSNKSLKNKSLNSIAEINSVVFQKKDISNISNLKDDDNKSRSNSHIVSDSDTDGDDLFSRDLLKDKKDNKSLSKSISRSSKKLSLNNRSISAANDLNGAEKSPAKVSARKSKKLSLSNQSFTETNDPKLSNASNLKTDLRKSKRLSFANQSNLEICQENKDYELDNINSAQKSKKLDLNNQSISDTSQFNKSNLKIDANKSKRSSIVNQSIVETEQKEETCKANKSIHTRRSKNQNIFLSTEDKQNEANSSIKIDGRKSKRFSNKVTDSESDEEDIFSNNLANVEQDNISKIKEIDNENITDSQEEQSTFVKNNKPLNSEESADTLPMTLVLVPTQDMDISTAAVPAETPNTVAVTQALPPTQKMESPSSDEDEKIDEINSANTKKANNSPLVRETVTRNSLNSSKRLAVETEIITNKKRKSACEFSSPDASNINVEKNLNEMFEGSEVISIPKESALLTQQLANILETSQCEEFTKSESNLSMTSPTLSSKRNSFRLKKRRSAFSNTSLSSCRDKISSVNLNDTIERNLNQLFEDDNLSNNKIEECNPLMTQQLKNILSSQDDISDNDKQLNEKKNDKTSHVGHLKVEVQNTEIKSNVSSKSPTEDIENDAEIVYKHGTIGFTDNLMPVSTSARVEILVTKGSVFSSDSQSESEEIIKINNRMRTNLSFSKNVCLNSSVSSIFDSKLTNNIPEQIRNPEEVLSKTNENDALSKCRSSLGKSVQRIKSRSLRGFSTSLVPVESDELASADSEIDERQLSQKSNSSHLTSSLESEKIIKEKSISPTSQVSDDDEFPNVQIPGTVDCPPTSSQLAATSDFEDSLLIEDIEIPTRWDLYKEKRFDIVYNKVAETSKKDSNVKNNEDEKPKNLSVDEILAEIEASSSNVNSSIIPDSDCEDNNKEKTNYRPQRNVRSIYKSKNVQNISIPRNTDTIDNMNSEKVPKSQESTDNDSDDSINFLSTKYKPLEPMKLDFKKLIADEDSDEEFEELRKMSAKILVEKKRETSLPLKRVNTSLEKASPKIPRRRKSALTHNCNSLNITRSKNNIQTVDFKNINDKIKADVDKDTLVFQVSGDDNMTATTQKTKSRMSGLMIVRNKRSSIQQEPRDQPLKTAKISAADDRFELQKLSVVISPLADKLNKLPYKRFNINLNSKQPFNTPTRAIVDNLNVSRVMTDSNDSPDAIETTILENKSMKINSQVRSSKKIQLDSAVLNSANSSKENVILDSDEESESQPTKIRGRKPIKNRNNAKATVNRDNAENVLSEKTPTTDTTQKTVNNTKQNLKKSDPINKINKPKKVILDSDSDEKDVVSINEKESQTVVETKSVTRNKRGIVKEDLNKELKTTSETNNITRNRRNNVIEDLNNKESRKTEDNSCKSTRSKRAKIILDSDIESQEESQESQDDSSKTSRSRKNKAKQTSTDPEESQDTQTANKTVFKNKRRKIVDTDVEKPQEIKTDITEVPKGIKETDSKCLKSNVRDTNSRKNAKQSKDSENSNKVDDNKTMRNTRTRTVSESSQKSEVKVSTRDAKNKSKHNLEVVLEKLEDSEDIISKPTRSTRTKTTSHESSQESNVKTSTRGIRNKKIKGSDAEESLKSTEISVSQTRNKRLKNSNSESSQESVDISTKGPRNKRMKKSDPHQSQETELKTITKQKLNSDEIEISTNKTTRNRGRKIRGQTPDSTVLNPNVNKNEKSTSVDESSSSQTTLRKTRKRPINNDISKDYSSEDSQIAEENITIPEKDTKPTRARRGRPPKKDSSDSENSQNSENKDDAFEKPVSRAKRAKVTKTIKEKSSQNVQNNEDQVKNSLPSVSVCLEALSPRSSRRSFSSPTKANHKVLFTGDRKDSHHEIVKKFGGTEVDDLSKCSILVTNKFVRTFKFLCALSRGIPIVSTSWLEKSDKANRFLDWKDYLLKDSIAEAKYNFNLKESLNKAKEKNFLDGFTVLLAPHTQPPTSELKEMVTCNGGKPLLRAPAKWPNNTILVTKEENLKTSIKLIAKAPKSVSIHTTEFILTGILRQDANLEEFKISV